MACAACGASDQVKTLGSDEGLPTPRRYKSLGARVPQHLMDLIGVLESFDSVAQSFRKSQGFRTGTTKAAGWLVQEETEQEIMSGGHQVQEVEVFPAGKVFPMNECVFL